MEDAATQSYFVHEWVLILGSTFKEPAQEIVDLHLYFRVL